MVTLKILFKILTKIWCLNSKQNHKLKIFQTQLIWLLLSFRRHNNSREEQIQVIRVKKEAMMEIPTVKTWERALTISKMMEQILQMTKERRGSEELQMLSKGDLYVGVVRLMVLKDLSTSTKRTRSISLNTRKDLWWTKWPTTLQSLIRHRWETLLDSKGDWQLKPSTRNQ